MTENSKKKQYRMAEEAIKKAGLDWLTIDPQEDYIEVQCPECKRIITFHFDELDSIRCKGCNQRKRQEEFYQSCREVVETAGFTLTTADFTENYIEIECPVCGETTSLYSEELDNVCCRYCAMEQAAAENGYILYMGEDIEDKPWEARFNAWCRSTGYDWGAAIVCPYCSIPNFFGIGSQSTREMIEYVKNYRCNCGGSPSEIRKLANERGFSVECKSSPYGDFELAQGEVALVCNRCGEAIILETKTPDLINKLQHINCECTVSGIDEDHLVWTKQGKIAWCADLLRVISLVKLSTFNRFSFDGSHYLRFPEEGDKEAYFAVDPSDMNYAFAFIVYLNEKDEWLSKYLLFRFQIATWGTSQVDVEIYGRWPYYYEKLYEAICQDIADGEKRATITAERNFDSYIAAYNALHERRSEIWNVGRLLSGLEGLNNALERLSGNETASKDRNLRRYIRLHSCPVCKKVHTSTEQKCLECGFPGLNRIFINRQEAENWYEQIVLPHKQRYNRVKSK